PPRLAALLRREEPRGDAFEDLLRRVLPVELEVAEPLLVQRLLANVGRRRCLPGLAVAVERLLELPLEKEVVAHVHEARLDRQDLVGREEPADADARGPRDPEESLLRRGEREGVPELDHLQLVHLEAEQVALPPR